MEKFNDWKLSIGTTKVIVRSNENEPFKVGELVGFYKLNKTDELPLVYLDGKELVCMGIVIPWAKEIEALLRPLTPARQWELLKDLSVAIRIAKG